MCTIVTSSTKQSLTLLSGLAYDSEKKVIWVADMAGRIWKCDSERPAPKEKVYEGPAVALSGLALLHT